MGKGARNRRGRKTLADVKSDWTASLAKHQVEFVGPMTIGGEQLDAYSCGGKGGTLQLVPSIWDSMPANVLAAILARRVANLTGRCPSCDAVVDVTSKRRLECAHEPRCTASNEGMRAEVERSGIESKRLYSGRRLLDSDPTSRILDGRKLIVVGSPEEITLRLVM